MRRLIAIALVATGLVAGATTAQAETGWARYRDHYVKYHFRPDVPANLNPRVIAILLEAQRERAIVRAKRANDRYRDQVARARKALAEAQNSIAIAQATIGFPAICVANAEEGGHNSWAGYFGFIYPPTSYGEVASRLAQTYGSSWLNWPWSAQLQVALDLFRRYGGSAWGPTTRAKCGI